MANEKSESQVKGYAYGKKSKGGICRVEVIDSPADRCGYVRGIAFAGLRWEVRFGG